MRECHKCGVAREDAMFYTSIEARKVANGVAGWRMPCRLCHRAYLTEYRRPRVEYADQIKLERGCTDCGIRSEHPEIYDFDHPPGATKVKSVARLITSGTFEAFKAEIEKCDVVCANCHRIRTRSRESSTFGQERVS